MTIKILTDASADAILQKVNALVGNLDSLSTDVKANLVSAINEVMTQEGTLSGLSTNAKTNLVSAINEIFLNIGILSNLSTTAKGSLVAAINELVSHDGSLSSLSTSAKGNLVAAINEVLANEGALSSLTTSAKTTLVAAINELKTATNTNASNITILTSRTAHIAEANNAENAGFAHNLIYRGKCLGDKPTAAQLAAIKAGTFDDMYLGDYWNGVGNSGWTGLHWMIVHFNYFATHWGDRIYTSANASTYAFVKKMRDAGWSETMWQPHVTVMQMYTATASEALNQKGGRFDDDATEWNDSNPYFIYGASGTTVDDTTGTGGYRPKVIYNALIPTFGYDHLMSQYVQARYCSKTGIYTGVTSQQYALAGVPYLSHLTGERLPQSDGKLNSNAYTSAWQSPATAIARQFAAFQIRSFTLRGSGMTSWHGQFWLRDLLGPNSSGQPLGLLGDVHGWGPFIVKPLTYSVSASTYHVYATIM